MQEIHQRLSGWLADKIREKGIGAVSTLAGRLGVAPAAVTRMKNADITKEWRRIEARHIPIMAEYFGEWPPGFAPMPKEPKNEKTHIINIHAPVGTMVIGDVSATDEAKITVEMGGEKFSGHVIDADKASDLQNLVEAIASARKVEPAIVRADLIKAMDIPDTVFITRDNYDDAMKILRSWNERGIKEAIDRGAVN